MSSKSLVEVADEKSRLRAVLFAVATVAFLLIQVITRPAFAGDVYAHGWRMYAWPLNVVLLLMCLGGGGGFMNSRPLRDLINDEVARVNYGRSCSAAFWVAMGSALVMFLVPALRSFTGPQAIYIVVTLSAATALLTFSWLEYRAHGDA